MKLGAGFWTGLLSGLGMISTMLHHPALGAVLSDPNTAAQWTTAVSAGAAVVAGILKGVEAK